MIVYAWKFVTYDDPADQSMVDYIQFSVQRNDVDQFCDLVINSGKEVSLSTTPIPDGSPHYLDLENDIIADPREEFQKITIYKTATNKHSVVVVINENTMSISLTDEGRNSFIASLQKSKSSGYFCEHNLDILLKYRNHESQDSKFIIWGAYENGIIYY